MRPAILLSLLAATACQAPAPEGPPPGRATLTAVVELFESDRPDPDLSDPAQAVGYGRQELAGWDGGTIVYETGASVVQALPDQPLRAAEAVAAAGDAATRPAVVVPPEQRNDWRLRLELRPTRWHGLWRAEGSFRLLLASGEPAAEEPLRLEPAPDRRVWELPLGRNPASGGYLFARVEVAD
ncbi:MAG: hypothetical protein D6702_12440 [Planctomycetota bacterium]|nr:MAG: hypothetical protein D6702_12440 [Planctomycetota bacterium]